MKDFSSHSPKPNKNKGKKSKYRKEMLVRVFYNDGDSSVVTMTTVEFYHMVTRFNMPDSPIESFNVSRKITKTAATG